MRPRREGRDVAVDADEGREGKQEELEEGEKRPPRHDAHPLVEVVGRVKLRTFEFCSTKDKGGRECKTAAKI